MNDERVWAFEKSLWTGDSAHYHDLVDDECVMVLPTPPHVLAGQAAIAAVSDTPRWSDVAIADGRIVRPQEGLIVIAYTAEAKRDGETGYKAYCTSTYRRIAHDDWRVVQHQQTPPLAAAAERDVG